MKLLIDADYIVYKSCASAEQDLDYGDDVIVVVSKFSEAMANVERELMNISCEFFSSELVLFFSDSVNFRKSLYPDYKGHRNRKKPAGYKRVVNALKEKYEVIVMPTLEADDALGIYATQYPDCIIVSPDKDMRQIPGQLYDLKETVTITKEQGRRWHWIQTLAGDQTDGYAGVPGYGVKTAAKLFDERGYTWETIVEAFESKGLTKEDALLNARLAKILQCEDYDFQGSKPLSWFPAPSDHRAYDGTGVSSEKN
jgi:DNA polymerase I